MGFLDKLFGNKAKDHSGLNQAIGNSTGSGISFNNASSTIISDNQDGVTETPSEHIDHQDSNIAVVCNKISLTSSVVEKIKDSFFSIDTETTGLSPINDRIVEIGAVKYENGEPVDRFSSLVRSDVSMSPFASKVNHITNEMLVSAPLSEDVFQSFIRFLGDAAKGETIVCAHNATFDFNFIKNTFERLGISAQFNYVDTMTLCRDVLPGLENHKQPTIEKHFGIKNDNSHRACSDAEACGLILLATLDDENFRYERDVSKRSAGKPQDILTTDEIEVSAVIQKMLVDAGKDIEQLRFKKVSSMVYGMCLWDFVCFKVTQKRRYIVVPTDIAESSNCIYEACPNSEGGICNKRVFFASPMEILQFSDHIVSEYIKIHKRMEYNFSYNEETRRESEAFIQRWYRLDEATMEKTLEEINHKDYSSLDNPTEPEMVVKREDVTINAHFDRSPLESIIVVDDWDDELFKIVLSGEEHRKSKQYMEALSDYEKARASGWIRQDIYTSFAQTYHALKDYDNEIVILDEGISYFGEEGAPSLVTRRDAAIKALFKVQEAERESVRKKQDREKKREEERLRKQEEKAELARQKAANPPEVTGRPVYQIDDEGNILAEYSTVAEASKTVGISTKSIRDAAKGVQKHAAGYCWKYKDEQI